MCAGQQPGGLLPSAANVLMSGRRSNEGLHLALTVIGALVALLAFGLVLSIAPELARAPQATLTPGGIPVGRYREVPNTVFTNHDGKPMSLANLRGRPVLMLFGYTYCPDVCPMGLADLRRIKRALGDRGDEVAFVFVSVDPERDAPEVLRRYVKAFDPSFIGFTTTDMAALRKFVYAFDGLFEKQPPSGDNPNVYTVAHTSFTYLLDREGRWVMKYPFGTPYEVILADLQRLLDEPVGAAN